MNPIAHGLVAWRVIATAVVCLGTLTFQGSMSAATPAQATQLRGSVSRVDGLRAQIVIESGRSPQVGDRVRFSQIIPGFDGPILMQGEWLVSEVTSDYVWVEPGAGADHVPGRGYMALIYSQPQPSTAQTDSDGKGDYDTAVFHAEAQEHEKMASDPLHNLLWMNRNEIKYNNWFDAESFCRQLNLEGLSEWSMPTMDQLVGLYESESAFQRKVLGEFRYAWSSGVRSERWKRMVTALDFQSGKQIEVKAKKKVRYVPYMAVLCVRPRED